MKSVLLSPDTLLLAFDFSSVFNNFLSETPDLKNTILPRTFTSVWVTTESDDPVVVETMRESESITGNRILVEDIALGLDAKEGFYQPVTASNQLAYEKHFLGMSRSKRLIQLNVFHYVQVQNRSPERIRKISLKIVANGVALARDGIEKKDWIASLSEPVPLDKASLPEDGLEPGDENSASPKLKMWIHREGIYVVPQAIIKKAGWDVSKVDPILFRIRTKEGEIPIRVIGEEDGSFDFTDAIEFWGDPRWDRSVQGEKRLDVYSNSNIYWLELGDKPGLRLGQEEGWVSNQDPDRLVSSRFYPFSRHEEKDLYFNRLPYATDVQDGDYWFYLGAVNGGEKRQVEFDLPMPDLYATQFAQVRIKLRGQATSLVLQPVEAYINNKMIASGSWRGSDVVLLESSDISPTFFRERGNVLTIVNRSTEQELAPLYLDWFEITYPKLYKADDDYIRFQAPQSSTGKICRFEIGGFNSRSVDVYKIGTSKIIGSKIVTVIDTLGTVTQTLQFDDEIVDEHTAYVALAPAKKLLPDSVQLVQHINLKNRNRGADYVMIVPSDTLGLENVEDLVRFREEHGLKVSVVRLDSIYNEFNAGIPNPVAIRRFLQYAKQQWNPSPRFVLLVGDGIADNRLPPEKGNLIPSRMVQTVHYGAVVSDYWYVLLDGDDAPDMAIGRLPVKNTIELKAVVQKILDYEKSPPDTWKNRYLMIGTDNLFRDQSETLIHEFYPAKTEPKRLYSSGPKNDPYTGGKEDLLNYFKSGISMINFRGHGGGRIWADADLLNLEDVVKIENKGKLPIISSMTCFTADFITKCLGEALINQEQNGAVAFWGSSGSGWINADYNLLMEFYTTAFSNSNLTLGELIRIAKIRFLSANPGELGISEVHQYNLLGDPAIHLTFPEKEISLSMENRSVSSSDSVQIRGVSPFQPFQMRLDWTGQDRTTVASWTRSIQQKEWKTALAVPTGFLGNQAGVRAYAWDEKSGFQANGYVSFSVGKSYFDSLRTIPKEPTSRDSVVFTAHIQDPSGIKRIWCNVISPRPDSIPVMHGYGADEYITTRWYGRLSAGSRLSYCFSTENSKGVFSRSDTVLYDIPSLSDLVVLTVAMKGIDQVLLESEIRNLGKESVSRVMVRFECPEIGFSKQDTLAVGADLPTMAQVPFPSFSGTVTCLVTVNPDSSIIESSYRNNRLADRFQMNRFNVTPESGSLNMGHSGKIGLVGELDCTIPPGSLSKASVFEIERIQGQDREQTAANIKMYRLSFPGASSLHSLIREMTLLFHPLREDTNHSFKPYWFSENIQRWVLCNYTAVDSGMVVMTKNLGLYRLWLSDDRQPPVLEIQVDNQVFASDGYVPKKPLFSLVIQDSSGVDIRPEKIHIVLDGNDVEPAQMTIPDSSANPASITVLFRPDLKTGSHTILAKAADVHGNAGQTETIAFMVSEAFSIQYLGNHPNPFKRETVFVYVLTDMAERISLKIYTVSGRRIRVFDDTELASSDYHEVIWDGKDDWGEDVANGVYFFRLSAETKGLQKEITGKIARLR